MSQADGSNDTVLQKAVQTDTGMKYTSSFCFMGCIIKEKRFYSRWFMFTFYLLSTPHRGSLEGNHFPGCF